MIIASKNKQKLRSCRKSKMRRVAVKVKVRKRKVKEQLLLKYLIRWAKVIVK